MSNIPKARDILGAVLILLDQMENVSTIGSLQQERVKSAHSLVNDALRLMKRKQYAKRAASTARPMTAELAAEIKDFTEANRHMCNRTIGAVFNVDGARVSEVMDGKWG